MQDKRTILALWIGIVFVVWSQQSFVGAATGNSEFNVAVLEGDRGLPHSFVTSLAQTPDGYLWIGTHNGLARYDGVRVVNYDCVTTPVLKSDWVEYLFTDHEGTLWIAPTVGGLMTLRHGKFAGGWPSRGVAGRVVRYLGSHSNRWFFMTADGMLLRGVLEGEGTMGWKELSLFGKGAKDYALSATGELLGLGEPSRLGRLSQDEFLPLEVSAPGIGASVKCLATDMRGQIWMGTSVGLAAYKNGQFHFTDANEVSKRAPADEVVPGGDGSLWVRSENRLRCFRDGEWRAEIAEWTQSIIADSSRQVVSFGDRAGGLWLGGDPKKGVTHIMPDGRVEQLTRANGLPAGSALVFLQDSEGGVWAGFSFGGVAHLTPRSFHVLGEKEEVGNVTVASICEDDQGAIWLAPYHGRGPIRWQQNESVNFSTAKPRAFDTVRAVCPNGSNEVWVADFSSGVFAIKNGQMSRPFKGAEQLQVRALWRDQQERMWLAGMDGLRVWDKGNLSLMLDAARAKFYRAMAGDAQGTLWLGDAGGKLSALRQGHYQDFTPEDSLAKRPVWSLLPDPNGVVWLGTFRGGLMRFQDGKFFRFTTAQGLPSDVICSILEDDYGYLWCGSDRGIFRVAKQKLHDFAAGKMERLNCISYGLADGLPTLECFGEACPGAWQGRDGRLWFATGKGAVSVQPDNLTLNEQPPLVSIEEIRADGILEAINVAASPATLAALIQPGHSSNPLSQMDKISIQPGKRRYEFRYTGISFTSAEAVRFRYRLEGYDERWVEALQSRVAIYTDLHPGTYRFQVTAANRDGVWNESGAAVSFTVLPRFFQTLWFRGGCVAIGVAGLALAIFLTLRWRVKRELARLELRYVVERERARIAQDMHDELGASLTKAEKLVEVVQRLEGDPQSGGGRLAELKGTLRNMLLTMDELVWAVSPKNDSLEGLVNYIAEYAREFLGSTGLRCHLEMPLESSRLVLNASQRHHLFLAFKEAVTNVVRHSGATDINITLRLESARLMLAVADNGVGYAASEVKVGRRGLTHMRQRLKAIGGDCEISNPDGGGTVVRFVLPLV